MAALTGRLFWIARFDGERFWMSAWFGVTIHSALSAAVKAWGMGHVLTTTFALLGSMLASFCQVRTPAIHTLLDPTPSVLAPLGCPLPRLTVKPRLMVMVLPTFAPAVLRVTIDA